MNTIKFVEFLFFHQVRIHNKSSEYPQDEALSAWTLLIMIGAHTVVGAVSNGVTGMQDTLVKCLFIFSWSSLH
jgi:uncharacterized membrane protein YqgA involved in biofilm formation